MQDKGCQAVAVGKRELGWVHHSSLKCHMNALGTCFVLATFERGAVEEKFCFVSQNKSLLNRFMSQPGVGASTDGIKGRGELLVLT